MQQCSFWRAQLEVCPECERAWMAGTTWSILRSSSWGLKFLTLKAKTWVELGLLAIS